MEKCDFQWEALRKTTIPLYWGNFLKREAAWTVCRYKDGEGGGVDKKEGGGGGFEGRFDTAIHTMILE